MYVVTLNKTDQTATLERVQNFLDVNTNLFGIYISLIMRKRLMPAKPSFLGEGNRIKIFFSPVHGHFCVSSHPFLQSMVTSVFPPTPFNPVKKNIFLLILCKIFLSEKKLWILRF